MAKRNSFTLLEILVAMAILGVVIAVLYTSFRGGTSSWKAGDARSQRCQNARAALEIMSREIKQAFTRTGSTTLRFQGNNSTWTDTEVTPNVLRTADSIYFTALSNFPNGSTEYDICEVGYHLVTSARMLYRMEDDSVDTDLTDGDSQQFCMNVIGLDMRYHDGTSWSTDGTYGPSTTLPKAVEITITVEDEDRVENPRNFKTMVHIQ